MIEFMSVIALILSLLVGYIIVSRVAKPHSKRMGRNGAQPGAPAPSAGAHTAPVVRTKGRFAWIGEYLWTILLVIAGLVIFFQGVYSSEWQSPSFALVGIWSWAHWLQLLVLWGIGLALLKLHKKELGAAEPVLQSTLIVAAVMAFLVCPVIGWIEGFGTPNHQVPSQIVCPDASAQETLTCLMTPELSTGIKIAVMADSGKRLCFVPNLPFEKNDVNGTTFWRFKTGGGQIPMKYRLFPKEMQCPDVL